MKRFGFTNLCDQKCKLSELLVLKWADFELDHPVEASPVIVLQETFKKGITPYTTSTGVNHDYDHQLRLLTHKVPIYLQGRGRRLRHSFQKPYSIS